MNGTFLKADLSACLIDSFVLQVCVYMMLKIGLMSALDNIKVYQHNRGHQTRSAVLVSAFSDMTKLC